MPKGKPAVPRVLVGSGSAQGSEPFWVNQLNRLAGYRWCRAYPNDEGYRSWDDGEPQIHLAIDRARAGAIGSGVEGRSSLLVTAWGEMMVHERSHHQATPKWGFWTRKDHLVDGSNQACRYAEIDRNPWFDKSNANGDRPRDTWPAGSRAATTHT